MRKKIKAKILAPKKRRAATYIDSTLWDQIVALAEKRMTSESHIMRILLAEGLKNAE